MEQFHALLHAIAGKEMVEGRADETLEKEVQVIRANTAMPGGVREADVRFRVVFVDKRPESF
jgi:hypothetical protein